MVGNISVGGNGKTPVLIAIAKFLTAQGLNVAIISRGYKAKTKRFPCWVDAQSSPQHCGDEPVLIAQATGLKVVIDPNRSRAVKAIEAEAGFDVILSDDGLQHYKMQRSFEIAVVGSEQAMGNGYLLPAGPLREPMARLKSVHWVLGDKQLPLVSHAIEIQVVGLFELHSGKPVSKVFFEGKNVYAITGIALPERFYQTLNELGVKFSRRSFSDHHNFKALDFQGFLDDMIVITEKDAVKCRSISLKNAYVLKIEQSLSTAFLMELLTALKTK